MKKLLCTAGFVLAIATTFCVEAGDKIAVVNISSIFQQLPARESVARQLEDEFKSRASDLQNLEHILQIKMQRLQKDGASMKGSDRSKLEKEIITQREQFSQKAQLFEQNNRRRQMEERNKILSRIQDAVKLIANKKGYDVVIDTNALAYINSSKDITIDVLKQVK
ncbi:molecular chaperone Skp [Candidatus Gillettellia adelgis]